MTTEQRIRAIRLMEMIEKHPDLAKELGIAIKETTPKKDEKNTGGDEND